MKKILILQTGGTIAMHFDGSETELDTGRFTELLHKEIPELSTIATIEIEKIFFEDSSDINHKHWKELSLHINKRYDEFDGFVLLHGTDTMAYTASALSFSLRNLGKPVILTGSQVPMSNIRSDARRNLVNAVELATHPIYEVAICFNDHLYRGNRASKMSIGDFDAFASPNFAPLAEVGIDIKLSRQWKKPANDLHCNPRFDDKISLIKLYPGLNPATLNCIDFDRTNVVIIETFGSGNFPMRGEQNLLPFIEKCLKAGLHVIFTSQAAYDSVDLNQYNSGRAAKSLGVLSAGDMTMEATITKSMHLLGCGLADDAFKSQFELNLSGERSQ